MSDNLVFDLIRAIRGDIAALKTDSAELQKGVGLLEAQGASVGADGG